MNIIKSWIKWNNENQLVFAPIVLGLIGIAFALSDWLVGPFTFSEYILFVLLGFFIISFQINFSKKQVSIILISFISLLIHLGFQQYTNDSLNIKITIYGIIKLLFYIVMTMIIYNYIRKHRLEMQFLKWNNIIAVLVVLLGIYITFELYRESNIPQEIFWRYTRRDIYSYYFESNSSIIRTRSLFSEPAHLGFYLNTLLSVNLLNRKHYKISFVYSLIISIGVILTFSYSMIIIMFLIIGLNITILILNKQLKWEKWMIVIPISIGGIAIIFWETIQTTLINRTLAILTGTDISARMRLLDSWQYVSRETILFGNGIGHTPIITNIYAYALSDMGIAGLGFSLLVTGILIKYNLALGLVFILLNMAKGGYLSSSYWFMILFIFLFAMIKEKKDNPGL